MKYNFKQIFALGTSALLIGMTAMAGVGAANYPAPFVVGGQANVAVVYGTGSGVSATDQAQATLVASGLMDLVSGTSISVEGGEAFQLDKSSNHFNFNDALSGVYSSLDSDEMVFLADGSYDEGDIDEDYEQTITLSDKTLSLFADPDYNDDAPTIGFWWTNGQNILNYTIEFDNGINFTDMVETDLPLLGGEYYVLAASTDQIDILDTSEIHFLDVGESATINDKSVTLAFVDIDSAKFIIDGESTDSLAQNDEYKLADDSYIVVTDISYQDYAGGIQGAEFAIGSGKIELINGEEAEINTEDIDGLEVSIGTSASLLDSITLIWKSDRDTFLTEQNSLSLPEFGVIQIAFGGLSFPSDSETISVENGDTLTINMDNYDLPLMWYDSGEDTAAMGEEDNLLKLTNSSYTYDDLGFSDDETVWWRDGGSGELINDSDGASINTTTVVSAEALNLSEDERFLVTGIDVDLTDIDTLYYEVSTIDIDDTTTWTVELEDLIGTNDLTFTDAVGDTDDEGDITVTLVGFSAANDSVILSFSTAGAGQTIYYNRAVSEKGLVITLPESTTDATDGTGATLTFKEANEDGDVNAGTSFTATVKNTTNEKFHVSTHSLTAYDEEESDDNYIGYVPSDLASKILFDISADENDFSVDYYGEEVTADVQVIAGGDVTTDTIGAILVTDAEVSTVQSKNLVVVGGSCINSVAATLVGGSYCTDDWTTATEVGTGQFLIKSYANPYATGKVALLVAGYEREDTVNAATYLRNIGVDTTVGKTYIGTTATQATLQVS